MIKKPPYKRKTFIDSQCPLCSHIGAKVIQFFTIYDAPKHQGFQEADPSYHRLAMHIKALWKKKTCDFVICECCSFCYATPNLPGDQEFYSMTCPDSQKYPNWKWDFQITFEKIEEIINQKNTNALTLIEIGAGNGSFLKRISINLFDKRHLLATEFSAYGQNEINALGITCLPTNISDLNDLEYKESFDFVCMFQVLEHLNEFEKLFHHISRITKSNANLFITVPNDIHRIYFEKLGFIEDVPPVHISRWNKHCFNYLGQKFGWELIDHEIEPNKPFGNCIKYLTFKYEGTKIFININGLKINIIRKLSWAAILPFCFLINLSQCLRIILSDTKNLGVSQWVYFKKI